MDRTGPFDVSFTDNAKPPGYRESGRCKTQTDSRTRNLNPVSPSRPSSCEIGSRPAATSDGRHGLYLWIQPSGSRSWIQRITIRGRRCELGLGGYPLVTLKQARDEAFANRQLARAGGDPLAEKRRAGGTPTFAEAAEDVWTQLRSGWRSAKYTADWMSGLTRWAFPHIGKISVAELTSADVIKTLRPIWHRWPTTGCRVRQRIDAVMKWAVAMEYRMDNPCDRIGRVLSRQQENTQHRPALPHRDVAEAVEAIRASRGTAGRKARVRVSGADGGAVG